MDLEPAWDILKENRRVEEQTLGLCGKITAEQSHRVP
jgi:hypothetical protein